MRIRGRRYMSPVHFSTVAAKSTLLLAVTTLFITACGGGGGGDSAPVPPTSPATAPNLTADDVRRVLAQAVQEASARDLKATIAVVDRVGNVLAVYAMEGAEPTVEIGDVTSDPRPDGVMFGLNRLKKGTILSAGAAISKAVTGAYLSSSGNAFSTRTASQIVQENFNPKEANQPAGPLFGVQFSQLPCSDLVRPAADGQLGPKSSPLGLSADPGGLPLYKEGRVVGGVGVISDGVYSLDVDITDIDQDGDELLAVAATRGFDAPQDIRANRITADGRTFRYIDSDALRSNPASATVSILSSGKFLEVPGYTVGSIPRSGIAFGAMGSGYRPDDKDLVAQAAWVLTNQDGSNRYPVKNSTSPVIGAGGISANEAGILLKEAIGVANSARAQIRRPAGSPAEVTVSIVDAAGEVLALARTPDAPVFGTDVSLQKARTALFFSTTSAGQAIQAIPPVEYISSLTGPKTVSSIANYITASREFFVKNDLFADGTAFSARAIGNIARPNFPDGIFGTPFGPLSKPRGEWSPFNVGLQLDLTYNQIVNGALLIAGALPPSEFKVGCTARPELKNGIQIFPGGFPIYRGTQLVGAIGISGDGVDQDDMIAFLGLSRASKVIAASGAATPIDHAPKSIRADNLVPKGTRLRYVQCPQAPFNNSSEQNVCAGL